MSAIVGRVWMPGRRFVALSLSLCVSRISLSASHSVALPPLPRVPIRSRATVRRQFLSIQSPSDIRFRSACWWHFSCVLSCCWFVHWFLQVADSVICWFLGDLFDLHLLCEVFCFVNLLILFLGVFIFAWYEEMYG